jgi:MEMO1 family protein
MLVFSAIVPHPPILIPTIGKENVDKLKKTIRAFDLLEESLNQADPDTIIVITPHGELNFEAFTINATEEYTSNFENFGDFSTKQKFKSDLGFVNHFKSQVETKLPLQLVSEPNLDHGASVPLYYLTRKKSDRRIVPIAYSFLNYEKHVEFGEALKEAIFSSEKKYAVIASGDLSHRLSMHAPAGFSPKAKEFDKKLIQQLKKKSLDGILNIDQELIKDAGECGLRSFLILLGILKRMKYEFEVLSYESPFGVGYLVGEFKFA